MKHTPGPWAIPKGFTENVAAGLTPDGGIRFVALTAGSKTIPKEESEANARLIAAAPDLLDLLQQQLKYLQKLLAVTELNLDDMEPETRTLVQEVSAFVAALEQGGVV